MRDFHTYIMFLARRRRNFAHGSRRVSGSHLGIGLTLSLEAAIAMDAKLSARITGEVGLEFTLQLPTGR